MNAKQTPSTSYSSNYMQEVLRYDFDSSSTTAKLAFIEDTEDSTRNSQFARPQVFYTPEVAEKMRFIVEYCQKEVGWMGLVEKVGKDFLITDVFVPEQDVTSVETDIDDAAIHKLATELLQDGKDPSKLYAWFHSHVNMAVHPSKQDEEEAARFLDMCPVLIRGIINKRGEYKVDVYYRDAGIIHLNVTAGVKPYRFNTDQYNELKAELNANVKERVYQTYPRYNPNHYQPQPGFFGVRTAPVATSPATQNQMPRIWDESDYLSDAPIDTGYGVDWDETTPINDRPDRWWLDDIFLTESDEMAGFTDRF